MSPVADGFDLCGVLRRIRRTADLSQRELAAAAGLSASAVGHAEAGTRDLPSRALARAAELAGLRLALLDADGREVTGMDPDGARDATRRRLPAHLDTQHTDEVADRWAHRPDREQPWFTFGLDRAARDRQRARAGTPEDHDVPVPGDSPAERRARRREAARRHAAAGRERRRASLGWPAGEDLTCTCPPACDEVDDGSGPPRHAAACACGCDLG
jgi:transcriptional regulator with XRE-family HTH domain